MKISMLFPVLLVLCFWVSNTFAQEEKETRQTARKSPSSDVLAEEVKKTNPYVVGENLRFVGKLKKFGLSFAIADFNFTVLKAPNRKNYHIKAIAKSRGILTKLFRSLNFLYSSESTVDANALHIVKTVKRDRQRKRVRNSQADFDYEKNKVTWVETDPNDKTRPPKRIASTIEPDTQDIVSAIYMIRQMPLAPGKRFIFKISDSGLVYEVPVTVVARERKKSVLGKLWCWKIEPRIFGSGKFIEQKGKLTLWITDDARRVPVYVRIESKRGSVHIKLEKIKISKATSDGKNRVTPQKSFLKIISPTCQRSKKRS